MPIRPNPGSLSAGRRMSRPVTSPRTLTSKPFDPADGDAEQAAERQLHAGAARCPADDLRIDAPILADGGGRQGDAGFGNGRQHVGNEAVGVRPRPDGIIAGLTEGIARHRRLYFRNERLGLRPFDGGDQHWRMAVPAGIRGPVVDLHRPAPRHLVEARVAGRAALLDDDPAVVREDAFPAPGTRRKHVDGRAGFGARRRQDAGTRPVGPVPRNGSVVGNPPRGMRGQAARETRRQRRGEKT